MIESKGREFVSSIYKGVNDFLHSLFETLLVMYDPNQDGFLEEIERDIDKILLQRTLGGEVYFVLIVLSRVTNKDKDKDLRFKSQALQKVSPEDFGVDKYLLLNEKTPMLELAKVQEEDFERMKTKLERKSTIRR